MELHPGWTHLRDVSLDGSLDRDFGLDSLGRVELFFRIEHRFCITLPERLFSQAETPRNPLRAILGTGTGMFSPAAMRLQDEAREQILAIAGSRAWRGRSRPFRQK